MHAAKRSWKQLGAGLLIAAIALALVISGPTSGTRVPARQTPAVLSVRPPNLADPAVRNAFAASFADGYFTEPQPRKQQK